MTGPADTPEPATQPKVMAARLREAREYLGFRLAPVADKLGWETTDLEAAEAGRRVVTDYELDRFARLYRRPVAWLRGETTWQPSAAQLRAVEGLSDGDREGVLDFMEWLGTAGTPLICRQRGGASNA